MFQICFINACLLPKMSIFNLRGRDKRKRKWREEGRGDYLREANIFNNSVKGGDYSREAINRGTAIIEEIR